MPADTLVDVLSNAVPGTKMDFDLRRPRTFEAGLRPQGRFAQVA